MEMIAWPIGRPMRCSPECGAARKWINLALVGVGTVRQGRPGGDDIVDEHNSDWLICIDTRQLVRSNNITLLHLPASLHRASWVQFYPLALVARSHQDHCATNSYSGETSRSVAGQIGWDKWERRAHKGDPTNNLDRLLIKSLLTVAAARCCCCWCCRSYSSPL